MSRRRPAAALATSLALGAGGYAVASTGTPGDPYAPRAACGSGQLLAVTGRVPAGVARAFLVWTSGASLEAPTRNGEYEFVLPVASARVRGRVRLEYLDAAGHRHEHALARSRPPCAALARQSTGPATAQNQLPTRRRPRESAGSWAATLDNQATIHVQTTDAACNLSRLVPLPRPTTLSQGTPSPVLLRLLGVLRRAPTPRELALTKPGGVPFGPPAILTVYRRYTRIVNGPNGLVATITVGQGEVSLPAVALPPCQAKIDRYLEHLLIGEPRDVQVYARRYRRYFKIGPLNFGRRPWLRYTVARSAQAGGGGGPLDLQRFRTHGVLQLASLTLLVVPSAGSGPQPQVRTGRPGNPPPAPAGPSVMAGLVPDGVASVTVRFPPHLGHGPAHYPHAYTATARVTDNAFFFGAVPRDQAVAAQDSTITWRGVDGRITRVVR